MVAIPSLSKAAGLAEKMLRAELGKAEEAFRHEFDATVTTTRGRAREVLAESPVQREARENIERLQLRLELTRNIRMNWRSFQKRLTRNGMAMRINQDAHLRHLLAFLETGKGVMMGDEGDVDDEPDPRRSLMTHEIQPTGAGKTGAFAIDLALMDVPSLTLVPLDPLLEQTKKDMIKIGGICEDDIGIVGGGTKDFANKKHIVATYGGHVAMMKKGGPYATFMKTKCKLVICDEVHYQALGDTTQASLHQIDDGTDLVNAETGAEEGEMIDAERGAVSQLLTDSAVKSLKIGFTATPRGSRKHVRKYFPHCLGRVYHRQMIEAGSVVPYKIIQCDGSVLEGELDGILSQEEEARILDREGIYEKLAGEYAQTLATYKTFKKGKKDYPLRGMAFCTTHAECEKFAEEAEAHGLRCRIVTGKEARGKHGQQVIDGAMDELNAEKIDLIITVEKLAVGFNRPEINAIVWARITSAAKTIQCIGRGARSHTDEFERVKKECLVFETDWKLQQNTKKKSKKGCRVPMGIANSLQFNGEDPDAICSMANGKPLEFQSPEKERERIRGLLKTVHTPATWALLKQKDCGGADFAGTGLGLFAISTMFHVAGDPNTNSSVRNTLGKAIWLDDFGDPEAAERERIRGLVKAAYTPATWALLQQKDCGGKNFAGTGVGIVAIARSFGIEDDPKESSSVRNTLGKAIWLDDFGDPEAAERERIRGLLKTVHTPATWALLKQKDCGGKNFAGTGLGLMVIATHFGVKHDVRSDSSVRNTLGRAIWLDDFGDPEAAERERIRGLVKAAYTPATWASLRTVDCAGKNFAGTGLGIFNIATLFFVDGNPQNNTAVRNTLGKAIWLDDFCDPEAAERERIRGLVKAAHTPATWALLTQKDFGGTDFAGTGLGIVAIATMFDVEGKPQSNSVVRYNLGRAIFGG